MPATVIIFEGEYDLSHRDRIRVDLVPVREERNLVIDLAGVTYIDSTCIGELIALRNHRAKANLPQITVVASHSSVLRLLRLLSLDTVFRLVETRAAAFDDPAEPDVTIVAAPGFQPSV